MRKGIEYRPVVINKATYDRLLKTPKPADAIALYNFYYYTSVWQETNQPKATDGYCMKGLKIGKTRFRNAKKALIKLGLIQAIKYVNKESKFEGHYIKVNFYSRRATVRKAIKSQSTSPVLHPVEKQTTNAYSNSSLNAYSTNNNYNGEPYFFESNSPSLSKPFNFKQLDLSSFDKSIPSIIGTFVSEYETRVGKRHPSLKADQWERVANTLAEFNKEWDLDTESWKGMVDNYFKNPFRGNKVDYNINHFATHGVLGVRLYEECY